MNRYLSPISFLSCLCVLIAGTLTQQPAISSWSTRFEAGNTTSRRSLKNACLLSGWNFLSMRQERNFSLHNFLWVTWLYVVHCFVIVSNAWIQLHTHTHTRTHARTHTRTHARTHTHRCCYWNQMGRREMSLSISLATSLITSNKPTLIRKQ